MKLKYWGFLIIVLWSFKLSAQLTMTTHSGQKIVQAEDGTWKKADEDVINSNVNSSQYSKQITLILDQAEKIEREYFTEKYRVETNISKCQTALSKLNKKGIEEKYDRLEAILEKLKEQQKIEESQYKKAAENVKTIRNIPNLKPKKQITSIEKWAEILNVNIEIEPNNTLTNIQSQGNSNTLKSDQKSDCIYALSNGNDGNNIIELAALPLFTYTSPQLKQYFKEKELMETQASILKEGKKVYLKLQINIISRDAAKNYGHIPKSGMLRLSFVNDTNVRLFAQDDVRYDVENYTGKAIYSVRYLIEKEDIDMLKKMPLDTAGIVWSSGFEMYDIYNVDTIIQLLNCLDSIN